MKKEMLSISWSFAIEGVPVNSQDDPVLSSSNHPKKEHLLSLISSPINQYK